MIGRPQDSEAPPAYLGYIRLVEGDDIAAALAAQLEEAWSLFFTISEESSLRRYQSGKWSIRQTLSHVTDTERIFAYRGLWFARGLGAELPGYEQDLGVWNSGADGTSWSAHVEEFRRVRLSTISLFQNMPAEAYGRSGTADGNRLTVRAISYVIAGHFAHHLTLLRERYLIDDSARASTDTV